MTADTAATLADVDIDHIKERLAKATQPLFALPTKDLRCILAALAQQTALLVLLRRWADEPHQRPHDARGSCPFCQLRYETRVALAASRGEEKKT